MQKKLPGVERGAPVRSQRFSGSASRPNQATRSEHYPEGKTRVNGKSQAPKKKRGAVHWGPEGFVLALLVADVLAWARHGTSKARTQ